MFYFEGLIQILYNWTDKLHYMNKSIGTHLSVIELSCFSIKF